MNLGQRRSCAQRRPLSPSTPGQETAGARPAARSLPRRLGRQRPDSPPRGDITFVKPQAPVVARARQTQTRRLNANSKYRRSGRPYPCRSASGSAWWGATSSGIRPRTGRWSTASPRWPKTRGPHATCSEPRGTLGMSSRPTVSPQPDRRLPGRMRWRCLLEGAARSTLTNEQASFALPLPVH